MHKTLTAPKVAVGPAGQQSILLILAGAFVFAGFATLTVLRPADPGIWALFATWLACTLVGTALLQRKLPDCDPFLFPLAMLLSGWGLVAIERLAPVFAERQAVWLVIGVGAMLFAALSPLVLRWLRSYRYVLLALALLSLLATIVLGRNPSGFALAPRLWLGIGSVYFQPSEAMKLILVAFLASYLAEQSTTIRASRRRAGGARSVTPRLLGPILFMWLLSMVILVWQRDLGTAMLFFVVFMLLLYVASGDWRIIAGAVVLVILATATAYSLLDVVQLRVDIWINPWLEADGRAYQIVQSLMAFAAGGVFGAGLGLGAPGYIPVVHSDFVFAAIAEEWGLLGAVAILSCFAVIAWRGLSIGLREAEPAFNQLLAVGLTMLLVVQALMIMGGVIKLLPLTGVTLPFISYGGSSLLVCFLMTGILMRLSAGAR